MTAMETANDQQRLARNLETALIALTRLVNAVGFYPSDHPALTETLKATQRDFVPLLQLKSEPFQVGKTGFRLNNQQLAPNNRSLSNLALKLVERRVHQLFFLPHLSHQELLILAQQISSPATEVLNDGGLAKRLAAKKISAIGINETNLQAIFDMSPGQEATPTDDLNHNLRQQTKTDSFETPQPENSATAEGDLMLDTLEQLKVPQPDQAYNHLLRQLELLTQTFFNETGIPGYLAVLTLLDNHQHDRSRPELQRHAAKALSDRLLTPANRSQLVDAVGEEKLKASQRRLITRLLINIGSDIAPDLLQRLYAERDTAVRRHYSAILAQQGEPIFPLLRQDLTHKTWHRVRNVVTILGETRLESALPLLAQTLDYPDARVRRAVISALAAIGGTMVIPYLLRFTEDIESELHQPAIMALGGLRNSQAIPPLVTILRQHDPWGKKFSLKTEVIHALAATRSPKAIIPLLKFARRRNLLNRKHLEQLRAEAIIALGQLGNNKLIPILNRLPKVEREPSCRALKQATSLLQKQQHDA